MICIYKFLLIAIKSACLMLATVINLFVLLFGVQLCGNNSSFQKTEGIRLVDEPLMKTISFDSMNSVKKLGMSQKHAMDSCFVGFLVCCINSVKHTTDLVLCCISRAVTTDYHHAKHNYK